MALQDDIEFAISTNVVPVYTVGLDELQIMGEPDSAAEVVRLLRDWFTRESIVTAAAKRLPTHDNDVRHPVEIAGDVINAALDAALQGRVTR